MSDRRRRFEAQALPHLDAAYNLARRLARPPLDADDIVQEAMVRAFRAFETFRGDNIKPWLLSIVRNCHLTAVGHKRHGLDVESIDFAGGPKVQQALTANTIALTGLLLLTPFTALLSDRVGRKPMVLGSALAYALLSYPLFLLLQSGAFAHAVLAGLDRLDVAGGRSVAIGEPVGVMPVTTTCSPTLKPVTVVAVRVTVVPDSVAAVMPT